MITVYDVAVVGSGGFLGSATAATLEASGASVGRFTRDVPPVQDGRLTAMSAVIVWAVGAVTPSDTSAAQAQLADLAGFLAAAAREDAAPHVVLLSSGGAVYGPPSSAPFSETEPPHPANHYGEVKLAEEQALATAGVPHTVLRVANPFGPGQRGGRTHGVVGAWLGAIAANQPVTIFGDGSTVRDFLYIDDCARAVAAATERLPHGIVNVGSGVGTSLAELLEVVESAVAPTPVAVDRRASRGVDPADAWLDVTYAREVLGWEPMTPLAEGIARTWAAVSA